MATDLELLRNTVSIFQQQKNEVGKLQLASVVVIHVLGCRQLSTPLHTLTAEQCARLNAM